jgi:hypothetical protein
MQNKQEQQAAAVRKRQSSAGGKATVERSIHARDMQAARIKGAHCMPVAQPLKQRGVPSYAAVMFCNTEPVTAKASASLTCSAKT